MRRALLALTVAVIVGATAATWLLGGDPSSSTAEELADRLAARGDPDRFSFDHRAGGTGVLDCVLPNRRISGTVDYEAGLAVLRSDSGTEIARKRVDSVLLHRDLFADRVVPTTWLRLTLPADGVRRARLETALGPELSGYVLDRALPATGRATALAALEVAEGVDALRAARFDGYRIRIEGDRFADIAPSEGRPAAARSDGAPPTIDVWLDGDDVVRRIVVVPGRRSGEREGASGGWAIDYEPDVSPVDDRTPTSVTDIMDVDLGRLRAGGATGECDLEL